MTALTDAYRSGLLHIKNWPRNFFAGIIVGIVALPLAMAFAIASGVQPAQGLYTAIIAGVLVGCFGGSPVQIAGPTGAFVVILATITARYGINGLQVASLMAGFILLLMGFARLGSIIKFIPDPVIVGFTGGIGILIFVGEWKDFFGLTVSIPLDAPFYLKLHLLITALPTLNGLSTTLGCISVLLILILPRFLKHVPSPLIAMVIATAIQHIFHFKSINTLGSSFGGIPQHLPSFHFPSVSFHEAIGLIQPAFTIALLGAIESLLSASAADGMMGTRHRSNQELMGQGLANIVSPLFGGFAATGAIARTATNVRNGGNSPLASIVHSLFLLLVLVVLAPLAYDIPLYVLAAILFVVAYQMSDFHHFFKLIQRAPRYDVWVLLITFSLTVLVNLVVAVNVGVILAMLFFIRRMYQSTKVEEQSLKALQPSEALNPTPDRIVYAIQGPFFFGVAEKLERTLGVISADPQSIIFKLKDVPFMDATGLETFGELIEQYHKRGVNVYLCEANLNVSKKIAQMGMLQWVCGNRIFPTLSDLLSYENNDDKE